MLNNLGDLLRGAGRPEAEAIFREAQGLFTELASRPSATLKDRHNLAIAEYNLGETLFGLKRLPDAEAMIARSVAGFEKLIVEVPRSVDFHSQLGLVQGAGAPCWSTAASCPRPPPPWPGPSATRTAPCN